MSTPCDHLEIAILLTPIRYETDEFMFGMYHESWWTAAFTDLCAPIGSLVPLTVAALQKVFNPAQARLVAWLAHRERAMPTVRNVATPDLCFADVARATPRCAFASTRDATSFTLPLHRWLAALIRRASDLRLAPSAMRQLVQGNTADLLALAVHPMRLQVLLGEVRADMWAKNGAQTMQGQIRHYVGFRTHMLELDLLFLQVRTELHTRRGLSICAVHRGVGPAGTVCLLLLGALQRPAHPVAHSIARRAAHPRGEHPPARVPLADAEAHARPLPRRRLGGGEAPSRGRRLARLW